MRPILLLCSSLLFASLVWTERAVAQQAVQYQWGSFACESEFPIANPEKLGEDLESVRSRLGTATGLAFPAHPVQIVLYASRRRYTTFVSLETPDARRQRGVFINRNGEPQIFSFQHARLAETLRHEATHALLHAALPYVPLWLDEGLATYFEAPPGEQRPAHPNLGKLRWSLRLGWRPSLEALEARRHSTELDAGDYRHAWGWVHFLLNDSSESRALLQRYLQNIADGERPQTMSQFLAAEMPDARERCVRFLNRP